MERLTGREENGHAYIIGCPDFELQKTVGMIIQRVVDKCADIEDILGDDYDLDRLSVLVNQRMTMREDVAARMKLVGGIPLDRLRELVEADREGRCVVLPIPLHRMLLDVSDPYRPEVLRDFRISATWTHRGIVFYSPWNIFLEDIEKGYIRLLREDAEAALKGENHGG